MKTDTTQSSDSIPDLMVVSDTSTTESLDLVQKLEEGSCSQVNHASVTELHRNYSNRRLRLQRALSVPTIAMDQERKPSRLSSFIQEHQSHFPHTNDAEDSTIEESWRPNPIERTKGMPEIESPIKSHSTSLEMKSSLTGFLDSLIPDATDNNGKNKQNVLNTKETPNYLSTNDTLSEKSFKSGRRKSPGRPRPKRESSQSSDTRSRTSSITSGSQSTGQQVPNSRKKSNSMKRNKSNAPGPVSSTRKETTVATKVHDLTDVQSWRPPSMNVQLSSVLDRESRSKRTSSVVTSGENSRVSIAISSEDGAKTFTVGPKEAQMIQQLLEASSANLSPPSPPRSPTLPMIDPSLTFSNHEASTIADSERISTRSSLFVELSPPWTKHHSLTQYLDNKRGRRKTRSSAFTVAGDKVAVRFRGKSTSELVELLKEEQLESNRKLRPAKSGARHYRSDLEKMALTPDLNAMNAMHESISFLGPPVFQSPKKSPTTKTFGATREDVQLFLDGRSPNSRRCLSRSHSLSGERISSSRRSRSREKSQDTSQGLAEFTSPVRPTNRRTLMRKMHSVPNLMEEPQIRAKSKDRTQRRRSKDRGDGGSRSRELQGKVEDNRDQRSVSRNRRARRSESLDQSCKNGRDSPRSLVKSASVRRGRKKSDLSDSNRSQKETTELEIEDLHKSFLDQFLDHDVEGHDSASQMKIHKDEYKASLRKMPQDPKKPRSSDFKRVKTEVEKPSLQLALLYDLSPQKVISDETREAKGQVGTSNQKEKKKSVGKQSSKETRKALAKSPHKKCSSPQIESPFQAIKESSSDSKSSAEASVATPIQPLTPSDRVTLRDLPRQPMEKTIDIPDTSGHARLADRIKMLSKKNIISEDSPDRNRKLATQVIPVPIAQNADKCNGVFTAASTENHEEFTVKTPEELSEESGWTKIGISRPPLSCTPVVSSTTAMNSPPPLPERRRSSTPQQESFSKALTGTRRLPPVAIAEGSVLEISDDCSVHSDITDGFSWEPQEKDYPKRAKKQGLGKIEENDDSEHGHRMIASTSWADLSLSDDKRDDASDLSRDKRMHLSKRWQSSPSLGGETRLDMLKTPTRNVEAVVETNTPGRLGWLKKKMGLSKARKMS